MRLRRGVSGKQLHGPRVGQVQRMVPRLQPEGAAQEGLPHHAAAAGSPLHEAPAQGQGGPAGGVPFHHRNKADTKGSAVKIQPQEELMAPIGTALRDGGGGGGGASRITLKTSPLYGKDGESEKNKDVLFLYFRMTVLHGSWYL